MNIVFTRFFAWFDYSCMVGESIETAIVLVETGLHAMIFKSKSHEE
jgi:hypothetical protein